MNLTCKRCGKSFAFKHKRSYCGDDCRSGYAAFIYRVEKTGYCWNWTAGLNAGGYGATRQYTAHRKSYEFHKGPIPDGMYVLHKCDNRKCVSPDHLFLGTHADNMKDMASKGRGKSCPRELRARGESIIHAKLTKYKVLAIRHFRDMGYTQSALAAGFGVNPATISNVVTRDTWAHV